MYRSPMKASTYEAEEDRHAVGVLDRKTMRHFDTLWLTSVWSLTAGEIRSLRKQEGLEGLA